MTRPSTSHRLLIALLGAALLQCDRGRTDVDAPGLAGSLDAAELERQKAAADEADPPEEHNLSELHFGVTALQTETEFDALVDEGLRTSPRYRPPAPDPLEPPVWNSHDGIVASSALMKSVAAGLDYGIDDSVTPCVEPRVAITCCTYKLKTSDASSTTTSYYRPSELFDTGNILLTYAAVMDFAAQVRARIPLFLPFTSKDAKLAHGWMYNGDEQKAHGSIDYVPANHPFGADPSFKVRASADGVVVAKYWDVWHGNVLILEHAGPSGLTYRTLYFHLRDGATHDFNLAKMTDATKGNAEFRYRTWVNNQDSVDAKLWGTDQQKIPVDLDDTVRAGQFIAWSGNTGPGGASAAIDDQGTMTSSTGNNHLHYMLAVKSASLTGDEWVFVDPYGVYGQASTGCYDLLKTTRFDRLIAPYFPTFHGVPLAVVNGYLGYYAHMGLQLATLSVHTRDGKVLASGSFQGGFDPTWAVFNYATPAEFDSFFAEAHGAGMRPYELGVTLDSQGHRRFSAIYRPRADGDGYDTFMQLSNDGWGSEWQSKVVSSHMGLHDFFGYHEGGNDLQAALFVNTGSDFYYHRHTSSQDMVNLVNGDADDGYLPVSFNVAELANGNVYFNVITAKTGDARMVRWGMSPAEYQSWSNYFWANGFRLRKVQGYANSSRYAAIWSK